jgi:hypothetical protein
MTAAGEHDGEQFYDIPVDFAPLDRPFRTLSTTESENEDNSSNPLFVKRRKPKKKKTASKSKKEAKSGNESGGMSSAMQKEETSSMVSYLTTKDKNVSHAHIEKFIHKSKIKYSVDEIRTAFENAKAMIGTDEKPPADAHKRIVQKWKKIVDVMKSKSIEDEEEVPGGSFSKSKPISILPPKPADTVKEGHKRLKLIKDARSAQKFEKLVPNSPNVSKNNDNHSDEQIEMRVVKGKPKGKVKSKKEEGNLYAATVSMDTGKKTPLALATMKRGAKKPQLENSPTEGFYRDFKFIYVVLPEPVDELPRE